MIGTNAGSITRRTLIAFLLAWCFAISGMAFGAESKFVTVILRYGDGYEQRYTQIEWKKGMTVLDAMTKMRAHPRGVKFEYTGSGELAFLTQIDGIKNQGEGRNWLFEVNGKLGDKSFGAVVVEPSAEIVWKFENYTM